MVASIIGRQTGINMQKTESLSGEADNGSITGPASLRPRGTSADPCTWIDKLDLNQPIDDINRFKSNVYELTDATATANTGRLVSCGFDA
jgi:hypothetical protein